MANPDVILTPLASQSVTKTIPPLTDLAAGIGRMSQQQGFPPITQEPLELGGKAPQRDDFNGAFNLLSQHTLFLQSGGQYTYNAALTYNLGCVIALDDGITLVQSLVDANPTNPNTGLGTDWKTTDAADLVKTWSRRYDGAGIVVMANTVLQQDQVGRWVDIEADVVVTLPSVTDVPVGSTFVLRNSSPTFSSVTVNSLNGNVGGVANFSMVRGEIIEFTADPAPAKGWWITSRSQAYDGASGMPIGVPLPYPLATPPVGYLLMVGQAFNSATYPLLALAYPSHVLPDMRSEFIRGWDNSRGIDPGRNLLSWAPDMLSAHSHQLFNVGTGNNILDGGGVPAPTYGTSSSGVTGGNETRPRSVAFNYICRAL